MNPTFHQPIALVTVGLIFITSGFGSLLIFSQYSGPHNVYGKYLDIAVTVMCILGKYVNGQCSFLLKKNLKKLIKIIQKFFSGMRWWPHLTIEDISKMTANMYTIRYYQGMFDQQRFIQNCPSREQFVYTWEP